MSGFTVISQSGSLIKIATKRYQLIDIVAGYITVHHPPLSRSFHAIVQEVLLQ